LLERNGTVKKRNQGGGHAEAEQRVIIMLVLIGEDHHDHGQNHGQQSRSGIGAVHRLLGRRLPC